MTGLLQTVVTVLQQHDYEVYSSDVDVDSTPLLQLFNSVAKETVEDPEAVKLSKEVEARLRSGDSV
jgi:hypothetical protein